MSGIKQLVDVASLPENAELAAGLTAYFATAGRPEHSPSVQTLFQQGLQQPGGIELELGTAIGRLRQERLTTDHWALSALWKESRPNGREASEMSVVVVVTAFPVPEHQADVIAALETAVALAVGAGLGEAHGPVGAKQVPDDADDPKEGLV